LMKWMASKLEGQVTQAHSASYSTMGVMLSVWAFNA